MAVLLRGPGRAVPVLLPLAAVVATAIAVLLAVGRPGGGDPASSLIGSFEMRTDAELGYVMLVPSGWESLNLGGSLGYFPPGGAAAPDRVTLSAAGFQPLEAPSSREGQQNVTLELFRSNPCWMAGRLRWSGCGRAWA